MTSCGLLEHLFQGSVQAARRQLCLLASLGSSAFWQDKLSDSGSALSMHLQAYHTWTTPLVLGLLSISWHVKWGERNRGAELSGQWQRDLGEGSCGQKWRLIFLEKLYNEGETDISDIYVTLRELTPHCSWVALAEFMLCVYTWSPLSAHLRETLSLSGSALKNTMQK